MIRTAAAFLALHGIVHWIGFAVPWGLASTRDFAATHHTCTYSLGGLCNHDHDEKTHRGAHLERHDPDWHWWPPGADPAVDPPERKPIGRHLTAWNLDHPPGDPHDPANDGPRPVAPP